MGELWDIYDENRRPTGRLAERKKYNLGENEYHIVVTAIIMNLKNEILISKRAEYKKFGNLWECGGSGSILAGETSLEGVIRETKEELGIHFEKKEAMFLKTVKRDIHAHDFKDLWVFKRDIKDEEITLPDKEAVAYQWVTIEKFMEMFNNKEIVPTVNFDQEDYKKALTLKPRKSYDYIDKEITVNIDRPKGSKHPKYGFEYPVNYGYVPNTKSGDGEELDCYVLGVDSPVESFSGKCISVIFRLNDDDDKLVVVPSGSTFSNEEIRNLVDFQEKYFVSEII